MESATPRKDLKTIIVAVVLSISATFACAESDAKQDSFEPYAGIYKVKSGDFISIAQFDLGDGQIRLLFTDFKSGWSEYFHTHQAILLRLVKDFS